jgi:hypothetical protein
MKPQKLLFSQDAFVNGELKFEKGTTHEFECETSVARWIKRGVATVVTDQPQAQEEVVVVVEETTQEETVEELVEKVEDLVESVEDLVEQIAKPKSKKENSKKKVSVGEGL